MTDRKKPGVAFWATVGLVVVLVGYPLSLFPIMWLEHRHMIPYGNTFSARIAWSYCAPARWAHRHGPEWIADTLEWMDKVAN